ncbi:TniQ family protein [Hahella sp. HN01]|uniref:TniQ family protein n=1 Tax=Hahella sp. HN01 TaxID=2847262 RepID=UPI001C1F1784|nr:TniQ family protein [Hahella sp. HN01]MBU6956052.1 TniQ family protein [Hahella sp. HN01]
MAKFVPLRLIGVGTPEIESAASFMFRLASVHGINVARMNDVLLAHLLSDRNFSLINPIRTGGKSGLSTYCRPVASSAQFRLAVKQYIGEDNIDKACVLPICIEMPAESWSLIDGPIRWCPQCLSEDIAGGGVPYLRLIWQFSLAKVCLRHWVKLERACPCCGFE